MAESSETRDRVDDIQVAQVSSGWTDVRIVSIKACAGQGWPCQDVECCTACLDRLSGLLIPWDPDPSEGLQADLPLSPACRVCVWIEALPCIALGELLQGLSQLRSALLDLLQAGFKALARVWCDPKLIQAAIEVTPQRMPLIGPQPLQYKQASSKQQQG